MASCQPKCSFEADGPLSASRTSTIASHGQHNRKKSSKKLSTSGCLLDPSARHQVAWLFVEKERFEAACYCIRQLLNFVFATVRHHSLRLWSQASSEAHSLVTDNTGDVYAFSSPGVYCSGQSSKTTTGATGTTTPRTWLVDALRHCSLLCDHVLLPGESWQSSSKLATH